jgi:alpha-L-fucosidase
MRTPHQQELLAPLAKAARDQGLRFGLYHSIMDWHHPDYTPRRQWNDLAEGEPDFDRFRRYLHGQVQEIIENYQPDILWFDGEWESTWTHEYGKELEAHVRRLKPDIIINNRVGKAREGMAGLDKEGLERLGDFGTPEQEIPSTGLAGVDWESCMTMNGTWGYMVDDVNWKSTRTLIRNLIECASKGGNYLLNVGPTAEGEIPEASIERLRGIGKWMDVNGEAIYGTTAGPFKRLPWGRATRKGDLLYLHVFNWPEDRMLQVPLRNVVARAWLLADERNPLVVADAGERGAVVMLPAQMPDEDATVIALEIEGEPEPIPMPAVVQSADGAIVLEAKDADLAGGMHLEQIGGRTNIGYWTSREGVASWEVQVTQPGEFEVEIEYACEEPSAGSQIAISAGGGPALEWQVPSTGGWQTFAIAKLGRLKIAQEGVVTLRVEARTKPGNAVMNIRRIALSPAAP